jgi:hypothetical protein
MAEQLPSPEEPLWEDRVAELELTMLDRLREHADKWRAGLTAMTTLVATASAVTAPFLGTRLTSDAKTTLGVAALVAVVALGVGALAAMRAAYGLPITIANTGTALREWTQTEVGTSTCWLTTARVATVIGIVALIFAAGVGFTQAHPDSNFVVVTPTQGDGVCGTLHLADDHLEVIGADGTIHSFQLTELTKMASVEKC